MSTSPCPQLHVDITMVMVLQQINTALESIYKVWVAVVAVLAIKFARTVAFAESICDFIRKPTHRYLVPHLLNITPATHHKWVPVLSDW
jgi:hypothetical protein